MDEVECIVIGAGVVGLAVARALAMAGRETIILERERQIGQGISSRSSEVIHAGIYYPRGSLKARFCVAGREALYAYCADHNVAHRKCQKLIVATDAAQLGELETIRAAARGNGVDDLEWRDAADAVALEPALQCTGALLSPSTGIIDSHGLMLSYLGDAEARGAALALSTIVTELRIEPDGVALMFEGDDAPSLKARLVINAAGLGAAPLTRATRGLDPAHAAQSHYAKGNYFTLAGRAPFTRLIYPVPEPGGLGVHLTLDLGGQARFGPDVEWIDAPDYTVDPQRAQKFYAAIRRYWPALKDDALSPAYAGVRPKLSGPGKADDFRIDGATTHGVRGLINLLGVESPGLTSSLAIADYVAAMANEQLG